MGDSRTALLLPCPFCGGEATLWHNKTWDYEVRCTKCRVKTRQHHENENGAVDDWNTRTPEQAVAATLGRGECRITASSTDGLCSDAPRQWFRLSCGHSFTVDGLERSVACPACGKAVS